MADNEHDQTEKGNRKMKNDESVEWKRSFATLDAIRLAINDFDAEQMMQSPLHANNGGPITLCGVDRRSDRPVYTIVSGGKVTCIQCLVALSEAVEAMPAEDDFSAPIKINRRPSRWKREAVADVLAVHRWKDLGVDWCSCECGEILHGTALTEFPADEAYRLHLADQIIKATNPNEGA